MVTPLLVAVALQAYDRAVGMVTVPDLRSRFAAMQKALEAADEAQRQAAEVSKQIELIKGGKR